MSYCLEVHDKHCDRRQLRLAHSLRQLNVSYMHLSVSQLIISSLLIQRKTSRSAFSKLYVHHAIRRDVSIEMTFISSMFEKSGLADTLRKGSNIRKLQVGPTELPGFLFELKNSDDFTTVDWKKDGTFIIVKIEADRFTPDQGWAPLLFSSADFIIEANEHNAVRIMFRILVEPESE
jgi:hypothetical protein